MGVPSSYLQEAFLRGPERCWALVLREPSGCSTGKALPCPKAGCLHFLRQAGKSVRDTKHS